MNDIARLGLAVDSRPVADASKVLDGRAFGAEIARVIEAKVFDVIVKQKRAGGMLA